jgi:crotonobetainyl-CoA:carnitine CoA-transferase CaiB-like acyl-CoA transferase
MLGDQGADVVRVDPPGGPRWQHAANVILQRGKRSIVLDLKQPADLKTARRLVSHADVVIENFRPGVMDRLGLGAEAMTAAYPRLVYCSLPPAGAARPGRSATKY